MFGIGDIAKTFMGLGSGLAHGIGGLGRKIKKFGENDNSPAALPVAPRFNPNARDQDPPDIRGIEFSIAEAERRARDEFGPKPALDLPIRRDLPITAPVPSPGSAPIHGALNPAPASLPDLSPSRPIAPGSPSKSPTLAGPSPAGMDFERRNIPIPALPGHPGGPTSYDPVEAAKYDYTMAGANRDAEGNFTNGFKRDWKQAALSSLAGAARGYATTGDVGGAIGGAAAGAGGSLISPQGGREFVFDTMYRPEMESREARERLRRERANMEIFNQAKLDEARARIGLTNAQADKLRLPERRDIEIKVGVDPKTGKQKYFDAADPAQRERYDAYVEPKNITPRRPSEAELSVDPESGLSVEEEADASYNARGGDQYVFGRLPAQTRQVLTDGTVTVNGQTRAARPPEREAAQKEFERAIERQRKTDLDYTRGHIRSKRVGGTRNKGVLSGSQPTANLKDLEQLWR